MKQHQSQTACSCCQRHWTLLPTESIAHTLQIQSAAARAGKSTASMGKFDKAAKNEKGKPAKAGVRQKALPVAAKGGSERASQNTFVDKLIRERSG